MKLLPFWARLCVLVSLVLALPTIAAATGLTITAQPQSTYVNQGDSTTLSVTGTASGTITYQWELNGTVIPGANSSSLTITNAQTNESGSYDVLLTYGGISVKSAIASVTVVVAPAIQAATTTSQTVVKGQYFNISPYITTGTSPLSYYWTKDSTIVTGQSSSYYSDIANASTPGTYILTVSNSAGTATSDSYVITVVDPLTVTLPNTATANAGDNVTFTPTITGPGPFTYSWNGPNGTTGTGATLTLAHVTSAASGVYSVSVSNTYQSTYASVNLTVAGAPVILSQPANETVNESSYLSVNADVAGSGTITYQWYKDGQAITATGSGNAATNYYIDFYPAITSDTGTYKYTATNSYGTATSNSFVLTVTPNLNAPVILAQPSAVLAQPGASASLSVLATAQSGSLSYQWFKDGSPLYSGFSPVYTILAASASDVGTYTVKVSNSYGAVTSNPATLSLGSGGAAPVLTQEPQNTSQAVGGTVTLTAAATGNPAPSFQWQKNGSNIAGGNGTSLVILSAQTTDSGSYTVVVSNSVGSATSSAATVTVSTLPLARVTNLSARAQVGTDANILIAGFIINGTTPKRILVRALGPTLSTAGVTNPLADPTLTIADGGGNTVSTNDDWQTTSNLSDYNAASSKAGAIAFPDGSKDSGLLLTLNPGGYTALVSGKNGATGVALVELYEVDTDTSNQLINISARASVGTGDSVTIAGLIVSGSSPKKFLVRSLGPALQGRGVSGFLADPQFQVYDSSNNVVASNDDWGTSATVADTNTVTSAVNAPALPAGSKDSALTVTLAPGGYTVVVRGAANSSGVALVEVYQAP